MNKKFTLIEIIVTIVVLSILLSIVMIKTLDLKKQSIVSAMSQNTRILQNSVDEYLLKTDTYPIENEAALTISSPQKIDIERLVKEGYLKKTLDTSKIKEQYYWIDVFGKVWGTTLKDNPSVNLLSKADEKSVELVFEEKVEGYNLYEVSGYKNLTAKKESSWFADSNIKSTKYKIVDEVSISGTGRKVVNFNFQEEQSTYLVSTLDQYGLEGPPVGPFASEDSSPLIKKVGVYEFEIESMEKMYWIDFLYSMDTPGESTINFDFKIKDEKGIYQDWTKDYFSLDPSTGITVRVDMKGDDKGNKPSLFYSQVVFKYIDEEEPKIPVFVTPKNPEQEDSVCPKLSGIMTGENQVAYDFYISELEDYNEAFVPKPNNIKAIYNVKGKTIYISKDNLSYTVFNGETASGKCMYVVYDLEIISGRPEKPEAIVCGVGATKGYTNEDGSGKIVYGFQLAKGEKMSNLKTTTPSGSFVITSVTIEYSEKGNPYEVAGSILDVPAGSCVNVVYDVVGIQCLDCLSSPPKVETCKEKEECSKLCEEKCTPVSGGCKVSCGIPPEENWCEENNCDQPTCIQHSDGCYPPACTTDCGSEPPTEPDPKDSVLKDPEWTTVDKLSFFGHGAYGQLVRWYRAEHKDELLDEDNTRIVYRYAKSNGSNWSNEYDNFETTQIATSVMGIAYIQVRTTKLNVVKEEDWPTITSMKFFNEKGELNMSLISPTLTILANKDNNENRNVYSDHSNIEWTYQAADPRNRKIVDIEWAGDIRENYPVGNYEIKARVKNEVAIWSEWVAYKLEVKAEKPVAVIKLNISSEDNNFYENTKFNFSLADSYDPDGDKIVAYDWKNKKTTYGLGTHTVSLRVKDSEGYWSDWTVETINIVKESYKIYRLEFEKNNNLKRTGGATGYVNDASSSGGSYVSGYSPSALTATTTFEGTGFAVYLLPSSPNYHYTVTLTSSSGKESVYKVGKSGEFKVLHLPKDTYQLKLVGQERALAYYDYIDIYNDEDTSKIINSYAKNIINGVESNDISNSLDLYTNQSLKFYFEADRDAYFNAVIRKGDKEIKTVSFNNIVSGGDKYIHSFSWDGKDNSGQKVEKGSYSVDFILTSVHTGVVTKKTMPIEVVNAAPIYRMEFERRAGIQSYSGGSHSTTYLSSYSGSPLVSTTTFEGTGFDIVTLTSSVSTGYSVNLTDKDGVTKTYTVNHNGLFSVRNLEYGTYTLIVNGYARSLVYFDYIDIYGADKAANVDVLYSRTSINNIESPENVGNFDIQSNQIFNTYIVASRDADITVVAKKGNTIVRNLWTNKKVKGGDNWIHSIAWDGRDNAGNALTEGDYVLEIISNGNNPVKKIVNVKVLNSDPAYNMEFEGDNRLYRSGGTVSSSASASNGKYVNTYSNGSWNASSTFEGTGFAIKVLENSPNYSYRVELTNSSGKVTNYNVGIKGLYTIRNLPNDTYTVKIYVSNNTMIYFDYMAIYK